jgi:hypothetical protein
MKICSKCKLDKQLNAFWMQKRGKYGVESQCKVCRSADKKSYYVENKEKMNEVSRRYYLGNKERMNALNNAWAKNNRDKANALGSIWRK